MHQIWPKGTEIWFLTDKKCGRMDGWNGRMHGRRQNYIPTSSGDKNARKQFQPRSGPTNRRTWFWSKFFDTNHIPEWVLWVNGTHSMIPVALKCLTGEECGDWGLCPDDSVDRAAVLQVWVRGGVRFNFQVLHWVSHGWKFSGLFLNSGFWGWLSMKSDTITQSDCSLAR